MIVLYRAERYILTALYRRNYDILVISIEFSDLEDY